MADTQGTILVKKKDGSEVRMTLAEFRAYKKSSDSDVGEKRISENQSNTNPDSSDKSKKQEKEDHPMVQGEQHLTTATPVSNYFEDLAAAANLLHPKDAEIDGTELYHQVLENEVEQQVPSDKDAEPQASVSQNINQKLPERLESVSSKKNESKKIAQTWDEEDHKSLLEEEAPAGADEHSKVMEFDDIRELLDSVPFTIPEDLHSRLSSLVTSRRKGVRTGDQIHEYFVRSIDKGGLGLDERQATALVGAVDTLYHLEKSKIVPAPKVAKQEKNSSSQATKSIDTAQPADAFQQTSQGQLVDKRKSSSPMVESPMTEVKPVMHDIVPPPEPTVKELLPSQTSWQDTQIESEPTVLGPVEEIAHMTYTDFSRLGNSGTQIREVLEEKFKNLARESVSEYFKGKDAWLRSPVQQDYLQVLRTALTEQEPLENVLQRGDVQLSKEDFDTIVAINQQLSQ